MRWAGAQTSHHSFWAVVHTHRQSLFLSVTIGGVFFSWTQCCPRAENGPVPHLLFDQASFTASFSFFLPCSSNLLLRRD